MNPERLIYLIFLTTTNFYTVAQISKNDYYQRQWEKMYPETAVSFASSNLHYAMNKVPTLKLVKKWQVVAWRGEKVQTQVLVWSAKSIPTLQYHLTDLKSTVGHKIKARNIRADFVKYVWTDGYFGNGCTPRNNQLLDSSLVADMIDTVKVVALKPATVQPIWLTVQIPENTPAGTYSGYVAIEAGKLYRLPVTIQVIPHQLPSSTEWKFELDLWQYPVSIAKAHNVPLWSEQHYQLMRPYYVLLAKAGQKVITTTIIEGGNQAKEVAPAMIRVTRKKDGNWGYDYSLFDHYVSFVMSCGISRRINCFTMVPWNMEFSYYDEGLQKEVAFKTSVQTAEFKSFWRPFLSDFTKHLKEKSWFEIASIAMDERKLSDMLEVIKIILEVDTNWHLALAGSYHKELIQSIDDYAVFKAHVFAPSELAYRKKNHQVSTFYTSCEGEKPNQFTFSPPAESLWMGWYAAAKGFDGYLRWAYNFWNTQPETDSRGVFPAGDSFLIYPGPRSSVRFEKLKEGIQDFEKIRIIRKIATSETEKKRLRPLLKFLEGLENELLDSQSADELLQQAKVLLNQL